jgi:hypothetical protein
MVGLLAAGFVHVGYNLVAVLAWLRVFLSLILLTLSRAVVVQLLLTRAS